MTYAYAPAGSTTMKPGVPLRMQVLFPVSFVEFAIAEACPLFRLKLNVWITDDPWLPTSNKPSDEELYLLPQAINSPINISPTTPSSHNRFDILSSSPFCVRFARARPRPAGRVPSP